MNIWCKEFEDDECISNCIPLHLLNHFVGNMDKIYPLCDFIHRINVKVKNDEFLEPLEFHLYRCYMFQRNICVELLYN